MAQDETLPKTLPPIPEIPSPLPVDSIKMSDWETFPEMKINLPIASGPFEPTWKSIEANYPGEPVWLRDAKFGIWVHFGHNRLEKVAIGMVAIYTNKARPLIKTISTAWVIHRKSVIRMCCIRGILRNSILFPLQNCTRKLGLDS